MRELFTVGSDQLGPGSVTLAWSPRGNFLAASGAKKAALIFDRNGKLYDELHIPDPETAFDLRLSAVSNLAWDATGEHLALLPRGHSFAIVWTAATRESMRIEIGLKSQEASHLAWSRGGGSLTLALGSSKGNLVLYQHGLRRKVPLMGKHTRAITCGAWDAGTRLALGGRDNQVTISNGIDGDTIQSLSFKREPVEVQWAARKEDAASPAARRAENCLSVNVDRSAIHIVQVEDGAEPKSTELLFQADYGEIVRHHWFGDGYIIMAFSKGQVVVVSTHSKEIAREVHSARYLPTACTNLAVCPAINKAAVGGGTAVRFVELGGSFGESRGDAVDLPPGELVSCLGWTQDGQVLTVGTQAGSLHSYLGSLPLVVGAWGPRVACLSSLQELSVVDAARPGVPALTVRLPVEPGFVACGPAHVAAGMNNQAWFYRAGSDASGVVEAETSSRDYLGSVDQLQLNDTLAAVLSEGRVTLHPIEAQPEAPGLDTDTFTVPPPGAPADAACFALTRHFLVLGTRSGALRLYHPQDRTLLHEFRHGGGGIQRIAAQPNGTRIFFEDAQHQLLLYNAVDDHMIAITQCELQGLQAALWDALEPDVLLLADGARMHTLLYLPVSVNGPCIRLVGSQARPEGCSPVALAGGALTCQRSNGALDTTALDSHKALQDASAAPRGAEQQRARLAAALSLGRLEEGWLVALQLHSRDAWGQLAAAALEVLDTELAIRAFRMMEDAGMVLSLQRLRGVEEQHLLAGHILALQGADYAAAEEHFLRSPCPSAALQMRVDLQHWPEALQLAQQLDPPQLPSLARQYAQKLERKGEVGQALAYYQQAVSSAGSASANSPDHVAQCQAGIARCTIQQGDVHGGRGLALGSGSQQLCRDCAALAEAGGHLLEAAELWEAGGQLERAAALFIRAKAFQRAGPLMAKISSPKLHAQFAKAKEVEGKWAEAVESYEAAGDHDSVVRLQLERLANPQAAAAVARRTRSPEAAAAVAKFCLTAGDYKAAVEFLLLAGKSEQAFTCAASHDEMDCYVRCLAGAAGGGSAAAVPKQDAERAAHFYESRGQLERAGAMQEMCGNDEAAVQLYLKVGGDATRKAIAIVSRSPDPALIAAIEDALRPGVDGGAANADAATRTGWLLQLHLALGRHEAAGEAAVLLARQQQEAGNYKVAHEQLLATALQLRRSGRKPPSQLTRSLMLLHSYVLVNSLAKLGDHLGAARLLIRIAKNISRFPAHVVPILTTTVVECQRAGLRGTAFEYAAMLVRPEYRETIPAAYRRKIEAIVRKREKAEEEEEPLCECAFCGARGPETDLDCMHCQNIIPFCIASGKRMLLSDWVECPSCRFPARGVAFQGLLASLQACPLCAQPVSPQEVQRVEDPLASLGQMRQ